MELPKFKLTKKAIVILTAVVIVLLVVITSCSNQVSLRKKEREIDSYVADQEQKITETIQICEQLYAIAEEAMDAMDTLTIAVSKRDYYFKNEATFPASVLLEEPSAMDGYYVQYVNDYILEKYADEAAVLERCLDEYNALYDQIDHDFVGSYKTVELVDYNACGFQSALRDANEALHNTEPHTVVEASNYGFAVDRLADVYNADVQLTFEGMYLFRTQLHYELESCKLLFDFVD